MFPTVSRGTLWWLAVVPVVLVGVGSLAMPRQAESKPVCQVAAEWVSDNPSEVPTTLAGLAQYSPVYRRAIYATYSNDVSASFWHEHLRAYLKPEAGLTAGQRDFVSTVDAQLDSLFALNRAEIQAALKPVGEQARDLFQSDRALYQAIFLDVTAHLEPRVALNARASGPASATEDPDVCVCTLEAPFDDCGTNSMCVEPPIWGCLDSPEYPACGLFGMYTCDGVCG